MPVPRAWRPLAAKRLAMPHLAHVIGMVATHALFQFYAENPGEGSAFTGAEEVSGVSGVLDTAGAGRGVDVSSASGAIITALLRRNPALYGQDPRSRRGHAQAMSRLAE
jgi:hypothetical protein